jgi:hypothetical protein
MVIRAEAAKVENSDDLRTGNPLAKLQALADHSGIYRNLRGALLLGRFNVLAGCAVIDVNVGQVAKVPDGTDVVHHAAALRANRRIRVGFRHALDM